VKTIVDYVVKNGIMERRALQEEPFESIGSIVDLFPTETAIKIVSIIDSIKKNATEVGA
jgi:type I restriction enzyme R subunit